MDFDEIWNGCTNLHKAIHDMCDEEVRISKELREKDKPTKQEMIDQINVIKNINLLVNRLSDRYDNLEQVLESAEYDEHRVEACMNYAKDAYSYMKDIFGLEGAQEVLHRAFGDYSEQIINEFYDER